MIRIIWLIGFVLIVLVGFVLGIFVNNVFVDMFFGDSEWIGVIVGMVGYLVVFLLVLFFVSKIEGKKVEDYGIFGWGKDWGYLVGGFVGGIGVFLFIISLLYLIGVYWLDLGNVNIVLLIMSFILFIVVGYLKSFYFVVFFSISCLDLVC